MSTRWIVPFFAATLLMAGMLLCEASAQAQRVKVIKFKELQKILQSNDDDTLRVVNFWATWCLPCVKEFPAFQKVAEAHAGDKVKFIFVSLDFRQDLKRSVLPFVKNHQVTQPVYLLDETDYNSWINKVDSNWEGNLPATLILRRSRNEKSDSSTSTAPYCMRRLFFPKDLTQDKLERVVSLLLTNEGDLEPSTSHKPR